MIFIQNKTLNQIDNEKVAFIIIIAIHSSLKKSMFIKNSARGFWIVYVSFQNCRTFETNMTFLEWSNILHCLIRYYLKLQYKRKKRNGYFSLNFTLVTRPLFIINTIVI